MLDGAVGDDKVTGDRGGDQMRGGAADDVLEWNDGDGSTPPAATGPPLRVNGSVTAGDAFELAPTGPGIRFAGTNFVPSPST